MSQSPLSEIDLYMAEAIMARRSVEAIRNGVPEEELHLQLGNHALITLMVADRTKDERPKAEIFAESLVVADLPIDQAERHADRLMGSRDSLRRLTALKHIPDDLRHRRKQPGLRCGHGADVTNKSIDIEVLARSVLGEKVV